MDLVPKNWVAFQHYKDRSPPWIKLHRALLDDRKYQRLPLASRALAPMLWLLASESKDGVFDGSIEELAYRLRTTEVEIDAGLKPLIDAGFFIAVEPDALNSLAQSEQIASETIAAREQPESNLLAACSQPATPETEGEKSKEEEPAGSVGKADRLPACRTQEIVEAFHEVLPELPSVRLMTESRRKAISKLWVFSLTSKKPDGTRRATTGDEALAWVRTYFERVRHSDFLMGRSAKSAGHEGWRCDLDFLLTTKGMKHVIEKTEVPQ